MANHTDAHDGHDHEDEHHNHITPMPVYVGVFVGLLFLTAFTVWIARFDFGVMTTPIAMLVATVKATLVCLFFMHLLHDEKINSLAFVFGLIFTALFFVFTVLDFSTRDAIDPIKDTNYPAKQALAELRAEAEKAGGGTIAKAPRYRAGFAAPDERGTKAAPPKPVAPPKPEVKIEIPQDIDAALAAKGKTLFTEKGCAACHSIDGTRLVGPTHKGIWGRVEELEGGGTATVDFAYYAESIKDPNAKITKGYPPAMAKLEITDDEIKALAEYSRSLGVVVGEDKPEEAKPEEAKPEEAEPEKPAADPNADTDNDGIKDGEDKCLDKPETINGFQDDDGCPDEKPEKKVEIKDGKINIIEKVFFVSGKFDIAKESLPVLDQLAKLLKENPDVAKIEIAGHTDATGKASRNQRLSFDRAFIVRKYLTKKGVSGKRLKAKGYGGTKPLVPNDTDRNRAKNRRVEFNVLD